MTDDNGTATDEVMRERRRLFLEEMARLRESEAQARAGAQAAPLPPPPAPRVPVPAPPARQPAHGAGSRTGLLALVALCLTLTFPVFGYIRQEAQGQAALRTRLQAMPWNGQDDPAQRQARLERTRAFFGLTDIVAARRDDLGLYLILRPGLPDATLLAHARHVRDVLTVSAFPTRGPQPWRVGVCSADIPCPVAVVRVPSAAGRGPWHIAVGGRVID